MSKNDYSVWNTIITSSKDLQFDWLRNQQPVKHKEMSLLVMQLGQVYLF